MCFLEVLLSYMLCKTLMLLDVIFTSLSFTYIYFSLKKRVHIYPDHTYDRCMLRTFPGEGAKPVMECVSLLLLFTLRNTFGKCA